MKKRIMTLKLGMLLLLTACGQTGSNSASKMMPVAAVQSAAQTIAPVEDTVQEDVDFLPAEEGVEEVKGRDLVAGLPKTLTITSEEIREALQEPVSAIIEAIRITLERCPPELSSDLVDRGIVLAGGTSQLRGMDKLLAEQTGLPVHVAEDPLSAVAEGTGVVLHELNFLRKVSSGN